MSINLKFVQTPAIALYTGLSSTGTSMRITPYPVDLDGVKLTMSDLGNLPTCTIDPKVSGVEEIVSFTGMVDNGDNTATLTGLSRSVQSKYPYTTSGVGKTHGASAVVVFSDNPQVFGRLAGKDNDETITGQWTFVNTPIVPGTVSNASTTVKGVSKVSVAPVDSANPIVVGDNDIRVPTADPTTLFAPISTSFPAGCVIPYAGRTAPAGWLFPDGSDVLRASYPNLFAAICPSQVATMTINSPSVVTATAHGLVAGDKIHFTTSGGLPSGVTAGTTYYVLATSLATDSFKFALSPAGTAVVTTGSQSGVHTLYKSAFGQLSSDTTKFRLPDYRGKTMTGIGATNNITLAFEAGAVDITNDYIAVPDNTFPYQGQAITLTTTGTLPAGLSLATTYYVIRIDSTHIALASSSSNAGGNSGSASAGTAVKVNITDTGSAGGVHTITYALTAQTNLGRVTGEEGHGLSIGELASHVHVSDTQSTSAGSVTTGIQARTTANQGGTSTSTTQYTGGDGIHNNISPNIGMNFIIKT